MISAGLAPSGPGTESWALRMACMAGGIWTEVHSAGRANLKAPTSNVAGSSAPNAVVARRMAATLNAGNFINGVRVERRSARRESGNGGIRFTEDSSRDGGANRLDLGVEQGVRYSERMTTCPRCRTDFDEEQPHCPSCGAPRLPVNLQPRPRPRVGPFAYFCLRFAQFATLLG